MSIQVAKTAGFCFGVDRAMKIVNNTIENNNVQSLTGKKRIYTFGQIIHNPQIIAQLEELGVFVVNDIATLAPNDVVIIRSHGIEKEILSKLKDKHVNIIDATCPYVAKIHKIVNDYSDKDNTIVIVGDKTHPEVKGIVSYCKNKFIVINDESDAKNFAKLGISYDSPLIIVAQTTLNIKIREKVIKYFKKIYTNTIIFDTICKATYERQNEALDIAKRVDLMLVVGGKQSSNTTKLFDICHLVCKNTYHIETVDELDTSIIKSGMEIGITAGASTPDFIIKEVIKLCQSKI